MNIQKALEEILPSSRIRARYIDVLSFAADAGFYQLVPKAVVQPATEAEIVALFAFSHQHNIPLVFRTGGTSLSGQSITDGILVDLSQHWQGIKVQADGALVRVQPGITGAMVNAHLKKFGRKIGPDPSSISAAMMGGILSNNASGMCCGVQLNSYHTLQHLRFILPDGKTFSTEQPSDYERFEKECPALFNSLQQLRLQVLSDQSLYASIRHKYQTKNTVGYSLNAFADYQHPLDIMAHLLIGGEGTLAFIAEAVVRTVPDYPFKSTALLYFPDIYAACQAIVPLSNAGAAMVELMDRASLRAVENMDGMPAIVKTLPVAAAALLIEFQEESSEQLNARVNNFLASVHTLQLLNAPVFTGDATEQAFLWKVRKGLFPAVGAVRAAGTTVILEDIAFPVQQLGDAIMDLQALFKKYHYHNAIIFGHAKDGNIHFVITQSFNSTEETARYASFLQEVVTLTTTQYNGTLKAEHGTGRNMAPFVATEWGGEAYEIMKQLKLAVDPRLLLNPGVIINADAQAHLKNLKEMPVVEEEVDRCIECGYCEHRCPSRNITATPRRRIVVRRALKKLAMDGDAPNHKILLDQYQYDGLETCAVDGLCATVCPVDINTGDLVKRLRKESHSARANAAALFIAKHFKMAGWMVRVALRTGVFVNLVFGKQSMTKLTQLLKKIFPAMPLWSAQLQNPPGLKVLKQQDQASTMSAEKAIVYFPACISRVLGTYKGKQKSLPETFISICNKNSFQVVVPANIKGSCCSQVFSSKGYAEASRFTANLVVENLWNASRQGLLPIVIDVSSCAYTLHHIRPVLNDNNKIKFDALKILDSVDFLHDMILPQLAAVEKMQQVALHPVCSLEKMHTGHKLLAIAKQFAREVTVPLTAGCCGMAGDRGFLFPELTSAAANAEAVEIKENKFSGYYSSTRTCEIALSEAVQEQYESILYLVDEAIKPGLS